MNRKVSWWVRFRQSWRETSNWNKLLVLLTAVIAGSNSCYIHYARKQFEAMSSQLSEIHQSGVDTHNLAVAATTQAETAKSALENAQQSFEIDERPYLVFAANEHPVFALHGLVANEKLSINENFRNIGRTPAIQV